MAYGSHLIIDIEECQNYEKLDSEYYIKKCIEDLLVIIGSEIGVIKTELNHGSPGVYGFIISKDVHIVIHTHTHLKCFFLDVFSSGGFNNSRIISLMIETFGAKKMIIDMRIRGDHWPDDEDDARRKMNK